MALYTNVYVVDQISSTHNYGGRINQPEKCQNASTTFSIDSYSMNNTACIEYPLCKSI